MQITNIIRLCINWIIIVTYGSLYFFTWIMANISYSAWKASKQFITEVFELFSDAWNRGLGKPMVWLNSKKIWLITGEVWFFKKPKKKGPYVVKVSDKVKRQGIL